MAENETLAKIRRQRERIKARQAHSKLARREHHADVVQGLFDVPLPPDPIEAPKVAPASEYAHLVEEQQARLRALIPDDDRMQDKVAAARMKRLESEARGRAWMEGK